MKLRTIFSYGICVVLFSCSLALTASAETIYGISSSGSSVTSGVLGLVSFDSANPLAVTPPIPFTGVVAGQTVRSIDFRPSTGVLYAVSTGTGATATSGQLYTVNTATAALTPVGAGFTLAAPPVPNGYAPGNDVVEIEFNPVLDVIRLITGANFDAVGNLNNNYKLSPTTGAIIATDVPLNYVPADLNAGARDMVVVASAYANPAAGKTTLYAFDFQYDSLVRVGSIGGTPDSPDTGRLNTLVKPAFSFTTGGGIGMDVGPSGTLYISRDGGLYSVNPVFTNPPPANNNQTLIGNYAPGTFITDISVARVTTAAGVTISGRLSISQGITARLSGLTNATVILTNMSGQSRTTLSGARGFFAFDDVEVGQTYTLSVRSRGYSFAPQIITVTDSLSNINLNGVAVRIGRTDTAPDQ